MKSMDLAQLECKVVLLSSLLLLAPLNINQAAATANEAINKQRSVYNKFHSFLSLCLLVLPKLSTRALPNCVTKKKKKMRTSLNVKLSVSLCKPSFLRLPFSLSLLRNRCINGI